VGVVRAGGVHRDGVVRALRVEATLLGGGGGVLGVAFGTVGVVLVALNTDLPLSAVLVPTNALVAAGAFAIGAAVALGGGLYPAYRAAWEPPVESLPG
jgi:putative ABC transport system permease protein